jgi:hypothetical protein
MLKRLAILAITACVLGTPLATAQAGFVTDVAKGTAKNAARHAKKTVKDAADFTRLVGSCAVNRATGRQC